MAISTLNIKIKTKFLKGYLGMDTNIIECFYVLDVCKVLGSYQN